MKTATAALALVLAGAAGACHAADPYPSRPIRLIVGFDPGGATDQIARIVSSEMSKSLGEPIIVENRGGAGSTIASAYVARAAPDGYTLLVGLANLYRADKYMYPSAPFDGTSDFTAIDEWVKGPLVIVANRNLGVNTLRQLIDKSRTLHNHLFYATAGIGRITHYAGVAFSQASGVKLDAVAFKGGAPAIMSVVAGETQLAFETPPSVMPMVRAGKLTALSVTSAQRFALLPNIPGTREAGLKGYDLSFWIGLFGPAGLPPQVRAKLYEATKRALADPVLQHKVAEQGMEVANSPSNAEFARTYVKDGEETYQLVRQSMEKDK